MLGKTWFAIACLLTVSGRFVYDDQFTGEQRHYLPLGDAHTKLKTAYVVARTTTGTLGALGAQHGQLILVPESQGPGGYMWAIDLHTIRDPRSPNKRLDLAELFVRKIAWVDVPASEFYNAKKLMSEADQKKKHEDDANWAPREVLSISELSELATERQMFSIIRVFHQRFAYMYNRLTYNCQTYTAVILKYLSEKPEQRMATPLDIPSHVVKPPSAEEVASVFSEADERETALDAKKIETPLEGMEASGLATTGLDTLDAISDTCSYSEREVGPEVRPFPRKIEAAVHRLGSKEHHDRVLFRAFQLDLHQITSVFEYSKDPLVFRGNLAYVKRAFTSAEHRLLFDKGDVSHNPLHGAEKTKIGLGPFQVGADVGGHVFEYLLNTQNAGDQETDRKASLGSEFETPIPVSQLEELDELRPSAVAQSQPIDIGRRTESKLEDEDIGISFLKLLDYGRAVSPSGEVLAERQRFTYAIDAGQLYIATGGYGEKITVPIGKLGIFTKKFSFDMWSKHNMLAGSSSALHYAGEMTVINLSARGTPREHDIASWTSDDEYEIVFDNNSGSFPPRYPSEALEKLLRCNFPEIPGRFRTRVLQGPFGAELSAQESYCRTWAGVDTVPPFKQCMTSLVGVKPNPDRHACCGKIGVFGGKNVHGLCAWTYKSETSSCPDENHAEVPAECCAAMVGIESPCATSACAAKLQPPTSSLLNKLNPALVLHGATGPSKHQECLTRQWRTRMFECIWVHKLGSPHSHRVLQYISKARDALHAQPDLLKQIEGYLDHIEKTEKEGLKLEHFISSPGGDFTFGDHDVVSCLLPFLRNHFPYVSLSMKFKQFMKSGIYDPAQGTVEAVRVEKLVLQYQQFIHNGLDYKQEPYKTGMDGFDGCPTQVTIPRAADEWGNPQDQTVNPQAKLPEQTFVLSAEEVNALPLRPGLGTYQLMCSAVIADHSYESGGMMIVAIDGKSTSAMKFQEVMSTIRGGGKGISFQTIDPSFCEPWCPDKTPIKGSEKWDRCLWTLKMYTCGNACCCVTNYEYKADARIGLTGLLGKGKCVKCVKDDEEPLHIEFGHPEAVTEDVEEKDTESLNCAVGSGGYPG